MARDPQQHQQRKQAAPTMLPRRRRFAAVIIGDRQRHPDVAGEMDDLLSRPLSMELFRQRSDELPFPLSQLRRIRRPHERQAVTQRGQFPAQAGHLLLKLGVTRRRTQIDRRGQVMHLSFHVTRLGFQPLVFCIHP